MWQDLALGLNDGEEPSKEPVSKHLGEGLFRCQLDTSDCVPFGTPGVDFDSAFHISIDWATDTVYIADTSRHMLRKYDSEGKELAYQKRGYKFPNQISFFNNTLYVADTNHHSVRIANASTEKYGEIIETFYVGNSGVSGKTWTYSFAKVGEQWWINNMGHNMANGAVAIYNDEWAYQQTLKLPSDADPIDLAVFKDRVWITDLSNNRIYFYNQKGQKINNALPRVIEEKLINNLQKKKGYERWIKYGIGAFVVLFIAGLTVGVRQARN